MQAAHEEKPKKKERKPNLKLFTKRNQKKEKETQSEIVGYLFCYVEYISNVLLTRVIWGY